MVAKGTVYKTAVLAAFSSYTITAVYSYKYTITFTDAASAAILPKLPLLLEAGSSS